MIVLCETCFPNWKVHEVLCHIPTEGCEVCGATDERRAGGDKRCHLFEDDPRDSQNQLDLESALVQTASRLLTETKTAAYKAQMNCPDMEGHGLWMTIGPEFCFPDPVKGLAMREMARHIALIRNGISGKTNSAPDILKEFIEEARKAIKNEHRQQ